MWPSFRTVAEEAALNGIASNPTFFKAAVGCDFNQQNRDDGYTSFNNTLGALLDAPSLSSSSSSRSRCSPSQSIVGVSNPDVATLSRVQQARHGILYEPPPWAALNAILGPISTTLQRDRKGRLRLVSTYGQADVTAAPKAMEDFGSPLHESYGSNMSATQENDPSVYARFQRNNEYGIRPSPSSDLAGRVATQDRGVNIEPATTGSGTERSYAPHDTGHLTLDYQLQPSIPLPGSADETEVDAMPNKSNMVLLDPHTPGQSRLFVGRPGTVLRPSQMFAETQPSPGSRSRQIALPSSSRPSPNLFPPNQLPKDLASSPLIRRATNTQSENAAPYVSSSPEHPEKELIVSQHVNDRPPLSDRSDLLVNAKGEPFTAASLLYHNLPQPFNVYKSRKESQERRRLAIASDDATQSSDDGFSDGETEKNVRARLIKGKAARELSAVRISRPGSSGSEIVEIPSTNTGRRRSLAEDYEAQCSGLDARDSQPDDTIADSQSAPTVSKIPLLGDDYNEVLSGSTQNYSFPGNLSPRATNSSDNTGDCGWIDQLPLLKDQRGSQQNHTNRVNSEPQTRPSATQSLGDAASNIAELCTPALRRKTEFLDGDCMVPETSPAEAHLQKYGAIVSQSAELSYPEAIDADNPFSQDVEFNNIFHSPLPPRRMASRTVELGNTSSKMNDEIGLEAPRDQITLVAHPSMTSLSAKVKLNGTESTAASSAAVASEDTSEYVTAPTDPINEGHHQEGVKASSILDDVYIHAGQKNRTTSEDPSHREEVYANLQGMIEAEPSRLKASQQSKLPSSRKGRILTRTKLLDVGLEPNCDASVPLAEDMVITPASRVPSPLQPPRSSRTTTYKGKGQQRKAISTDSNSVATPALDQPEVLPRLRSAGQVRGSSRLLRRKEEDSNEVSNAASPTRVASMPPLKKSLRLSRRVSIDSSERAKSSELEITASPVLSKLRRSATARLEEAGLFNNMAFSVTYSTDREAEKGEVVGAILHHGGRILTKGFDELFDTTRFQSALSARSAESENDSGGSNVTLTAEARGMGFVCLVADEHSRRVKFMQALALGLPCVSGRWIEHCVAKGEILDWDQYLLAAGESSFLGGAIRNRNLQPYPASTAKFENRFSLRPKLLTGKSILLITGKGRVEERRKPYFFLTYVLGARSVTRVQTTQEARRVLLDSEKHAQKWDWVYVGDNEDDAEKAIFGPSVAPARKRKRGAEVIDEREASSGPPKKVRIVGDEYVIQSLILGKFIEQD